MDKTTIKKAVLVSLLIILAILVRLGYQYPWHPDHYTIGQYTYMIIEKGYAPWVLHPLSLFGYYPLSTPSGFEYFMAFTARITGLELPTLFFLGSFFAALFGGLLLFIMLREFMNFEKSIIITTIFLTIVTFTRNTSNTASSRIFNIIFYPLFILFLFKIFEYYNENKKLNMKYIVISILLFLFMSLIHRLSQLSLIFIASFVGSFILVKRNNILEWYKTTGLYSRREKYYKHSSLYIVVDLLVVFLLIFSFTFIRLKFIWLLFSLIVIAYYIFFDLNAILRKKSLIYMEIIFYLLLLIISKSLDLLFRERLIINLLILWEKHSYSLVIYPLSFILFSIILFLLIKKYKKILVFMNKPIMYIINFTKKDFDKILSILFFIIFIVYISKSFTGEGIRTFGFEHYTKSFILKGNSPLIIFTNYIFNLNNNLSVLIVFAAIGILYLFFKKNKTFYDYFFIIVAIGFAQFVLDWEYVRLYMTAIYAIFIGIGFTFIIRKILSKKYKLLASIILVMLLSAHFAIGNIFVQREIMLDKLGLQQKRYSIPETYYINAGNFLKDNEEFSIHTSSSIQYDRKLAYYSKKLVAAIADIKYIDKENFLIERISFKDISNSFFSGKPIKEIYVTTDNIFGGGYYFGKYIVRLNNLDGQVATTQVLESIIKSFKIKYIIDSPSNTRKTKFFDSVQPIQNNVYSSDQLEIYDLSKGR